jgi:hypothetical protein
MVITITAIGGLVGLVISIGLLAWQTRGVGQQMEVQAAERFTGWRTSIWPDDALYSAMQGVSPGRSRGDAGWSGC